MPDTFLWAKRKSLFIMYAVFLLGSCNGCTFTLISIDAPPGPAPDYRAIIAKGLVAVTKPSSVGGGSYFVDQAGMFLPDKMLDQIEISDPATMVQTRNGWVWQTCMHLNIDNKPSTYAVFIADGRPVNAREAIVTDNCEGANYAPLDVRKYNPVTPNARKIGK